MLENKQAAESWLAELFSAGPPGLICLWILNEDTKKSHTKIIKAPADIHAVNVGPRENLYYRVTLLRDDFQPPEDKPQSRGLVSDTSGLVAFVADFDIAAPDRDQKKTPPPDFATIMKIIEALKVRPSRLIDSGRGVHAYWLFSSTVELFTSAEINEAAHLSELFHRTIVVPAVKSVGEYDVDSVFDLARVLRVPGSKHIKTGNPVAEIRDNGGAFGDVYDYDDLTDEVKRLAKLENVKATPTTSERMATVDGGDWNLTREPQHGVVEVIKTHPRVRQILAHKAKDLPSPSEIDFAVASICLNLEHIADDEIARVLVWVRKTMGNPPKRNTPGALVEYYKTTIAKAKERRLDEDEVADAVERVRRAQAKAIAEPEPTQKQAKTPEPPKETPETKQAPETPSTAPKPTPSVTPSAAERFVNIDILERKTGLKIVRLIKYHSHSPLYELHIAGTSTAVECRIEDITSPKHFRDRVAAVTDKLVPSFGKKEWDDLATLLLSLVEYADLDLTARTQLEEWLNDYLENMPPGEWDKRGDLYPRPFYMETRPERIAVSVIHFSRFIKQQGTGTVTPGDIRIRMKQAGWKRVAVDFPKKKKSDDKVGVRRFLWTVELTGFWKEDAAEAIELKEQAERERQREEERQKQNTLNEDGHLEDIPF